MPREEDRRSGKFVGLDGCGEQARGGAKSRRALARIQDKYKAAVGVILHRKDAWPRNRHRRNSVPARFPTQSKSLSIEQ